METFHIGVATKKKKSKRSKKVKANKNPVYSAAPVYNTYSKPLQFNFNNTFKWYIPSGFNVSKSIQLKFDRLSSCSIVSFTKELRQEIYNSSIQGFLSLDTWKPPPQIKSYLQSVKDKEKNEWIKVKLIYYKIFKLVRSIKILIRKRKIYKTLHNVLNIDDPATLEKPMKPVYVYNFNKTCTYVYEASTLLKEINRRLLTSDYMFVDPQEPRNLLSNKPFTMSQYISIIMQFKAYGMFSWIFDRFKACEFNIKKFKIRYRQQLKISAIETFFNTNTDLYRETVEDYFIINANVCDVPDEYIIKFKNTLYYNNNSLYIKRWISLTKRYYIAKELNDLNEIKEIENLGDDLISKIHILL
jgi:hypothetical protein